MERQFARAVIRYEAMLEDLEVRLMEANEKAEELQRENARLENELHEARHGEQEALEQDDPGEELGETAKARKARERALAERETVTDIREAEG